MSNKTPLKLFYSYSHRDESLRDELDAHLKILERQEYISSWHDRKITAGDEWKGQIDDNLKSAEIILLLISSDFIASDYCYDIEMELALKMHEEKTAKVIPIILRDCVWSIAPFSKLQALPTDGKAVTGEDWHNKDKAFKVVAEGLKTMIDEFREIRVIESIQVMHSDSYNYQKIQLKQIPVSKPYFSGREKELEKLHELFESKHFILIEGAGGIGKTQFVSKFIDNVGIRERTIWYECNPTSQPDDIIRGAGFEEILIGDNKSEKDKFIAFKEKIEEYELVIFLDNYQDIQLNENFQSFLSYVNTYLGAGCVVVIGRDNITSATLQPARIHLSGLGDSSVQHARRLIEHAFPEKKNIEDSVLENICETLLGYPLAIDLAMYLLSQNVTPDKILEVAVLEAQNNGEKISERLLNEIFTRPDATEDEQEFLKGFSIYRGNVTKDAAKAVTNVSSFDLTIRKLINKNILTDYGDYLEIHPLIREFCYEKLTSKVEKHTLASTYFISLRNQEFNPVLEEKIYYHLSCASLWSEIGKSIELFGNEFIIQGYLNRLAQMITETKNNGITKPQFEIFEGDIAQIKGNWKEALQIFEKIVQDDVGNFEAVIKYGEMLFRTSRKEEALKQYEIVLNSIVDENNNWYARALNNIGLIFTYSDSRKSLDFLNRALAIRERLGNLRDIGITLHNISLLKSDKKDYNTALKLGEKALEICKQLNDRENQAKYLTNIGNIKLKQDNPRAAFNYFDEAIRICKQIGDMIGLSNAYGHLGNYYKKIHNKEKALEYYEKDHVLAEQLGYTHGLSVCHSNIGMLLFENFHENDSSCYNLLKSIAYSIKAGDDNIHSRICLVNMKQKLGRVSFKEILIQNYEKLGNLKDYIDLSELSGDPKTVNKIGRNEPCPCGSGKKYKACHGKGV